LSYISMRRRRREVGKIEEGIERVEVKEEV
jgi:hypothetical protein